MLSGSLQGVIHVSYHPTSAEKCVRPLLDGCHVRGFWNLGSTLISIVQFIAA